MKSLKYTYKYNFNFFFWSSKRK